MDPRTHATTLLNEWQEYKNIHYSQKTRFSNAVDIEIEKDAVGQLATLVMSGLRSDSVPESEILFRVNTFEHHLRSLKDMLTFELLKNGN